MKGDARAGPVVQQETPRFPVRRVVAGDRQSPSRAVPWSEWLEREFAARGRRTASRIEADRAGAWRERPNKTFLQRLIHIKANRRFRRQRGQHVVRTEEFAPMTTMTMPTTAARTQTDHTKGVSQVMPLLLAMVLLAATAVVSILISGPMH